MKRKPPAPAQSMVVASKVERAIYRFRSQHVLLDADLAGLYGVPTKALVQAIKRHRGRFPADFMFQLTREEYRFLRSQSVTSSGWGGRRYPPFAFTEQGVAMLSSVLNSPRAIKVNIEIMRAFFRLRQVLADNRDLAIKLKELEQKTEVRFEAVFQTLRQLLAEPAKPRRAIGFRVR